MGGTHFSPPTAGSRALLAGTPLPAQRRLWLGAWPHSSCPGTEGRGEAKPGAIRPSRGGSRPADRDTARDSGPFAQLSPRRVRGPRQTAKPWDALRPCGDSPPCSGCSRGQSAVQRGQSPTPQREDRPCSQLGLPVSTKSISCSSTLRGDRGALPVTTVLARGQTEPRGVHPRIQLTWLNMRGIKRERPAASATEMRRVSTASRLSPPHAGRRRAGVSN